MPDQTTNTDEQRIPDKLVQDVLSASLKPRKNIHKDGSLDKTPLILSTSAENLNNTSLRNDYNQYIDIESEIPDEITKTDATLITSLEKPSITLAVAEKLQHDAAIEQRDDYDIRTDSVSTKVPINIVNLTSTNDTIDNFQTVTSLATDNNEISKHEQSHITSKKTDSNIKPKSIMKKTKAVSHNHVENNETLLIKDESKSMNKQTVTETITPVDSTMSPKPEKQHPSDYTMTDIWNAYDKTEDGQHSDEKSVSMQFNRLTPSSNMPTVSQQDSSHETSDAHSTEELSRPKFLLRLKPTTILDLNDTLILEVHFVGQPKPKV